MKMRYLMLALAGAVLVTALALCERRLLPVVVIPNPYIDPYQIQSGIYRADRQPPEEDAAVHAVIVPHHLVATESVALGVRALAQAAPEQIVLLSPDHFDACPSLLCTANTLYETPFAQVQANEALLRLLDMSEMVSVKGELFRREHGIHAIVPYIARYIPEATVTPVVFSQRLLWKADANELLKLFGRLVDERTVLVVSSDFSHYLPLDEADEMDSMSREAIENANLAAIARLRNPAQSDCPSCLWIIAAMAKERGWTPKVRMHTNSARLLNEPGAGETTSHFVVTYH